MKGKRQIVLLVFMLFFIIGLMIGILTGVFFGHRNEGRIDDNPNQVMNVEGVKNEVVVN